MIYLLIFSDILARLQQILRRPASQELSQNDIRALLVLIFIVALLAENCKYDALRRDNPSMSQHQISRVHITNEHLRSSGRFK